LNNTKFYSASSIQRGWEEFHDVPLQKNEEFVTGRGWTATELRRKVRSQNSLFIYCHSYFVFSLSRVSKICTNFGLFYIKKEIYCSQLDLPLREILYQLNPWMKIDIST
jgi:hypothetical protein